MLCSARYMCRWLGRMSLSAFWRNPKQQQQLQRQQDKKRCHGTDVLQDESWQGRMRQDER